MLFQVPLLLSPPGEIPVQGGGTRKIHYALQDFRATYLDEYTREPLPHELVRAAIREELESLMGACGSWRMRRLSCRIRKRK